MQLPPGTINAWYDVEKQFLARFFENDTKISVHSLLATKQGEEETVKNFIERFREKSMYCRHGMTQETLVETCKYNLMTGVLIRMRAVKSKTWKDLLKQGEQAENIIRRIEESRSTRNSINNRPYPQNPENKGKAVMASVAHPKPRPQNPRGAGQNKPR